jgi:hypothetical protein
MVIFSVLQSDFSHKLTILTKILLENLYWLPFIIIGEINSSLNFSKQRYTKNTKIDKKKSDVPKNDLFSNSRANIGRF